MPPDDTSRIPVAASDALNAAMLVAIGSSIRGDVRFLAGLSITVAGFAVAALAMWRTGTGPAVAWRSRIGPLLVATATVSLFTPSLHGPAWFEWSRRAFSLAAIGAAVLVWGDTPGSRRAVAAVIVLASAVHLATPFAIPKPQIDVWEWTQTCIQALLHGVHPYTIRADAAVRGPDLWRTAAFYPYMPFTLVAFSPGVMLFGDYRLVSALCVPATVALIYAMGRRLHLDRSLLDAATLAFLVFPRAIELTCYGWTEPLLVTALAAFAYLAVRAPGGAAEAIAFFLLPSLKQYFAAPVLLYLAAGRTRLRALAAGVAVAAATVVPFLLWDWHSTLAGITTQMIAPSGPRLDADSLVALVGAKSGVIVSRWVSVAVQLLVAAIAWRRLRRHGLGGLLLASALALCATFLSGWQAFVNYYYLVSAMLVAAALPLSSTFVTNAPVRPDKEPM
jgi:hypothetical protein